MLPKPGKDPHQTASYRPILLLPVLSKILDTIIYDRLKPTIEEKEINIRSPIWIQKQTLYDGANFTNNRKETRQYSHYITIHYSTIQYSHAIHGH